MHYPHTDRFLGLFFILAGALIRYKLFGPPDWQAIKGETPAHIFRWLAGVLGSFLLYTGMLMLALFGV